MTGFDPLFAITFESFTDVEFWTSLQRQHARGDIPDFYPYDQDLRFL